MDEHLVATLNRAAVGAGLAFEGYIVVLAGSCIGHSNDHLARWRGGGMIAHAIEQAAVGRRG